MSVLYPSARAASVSCGANHVVVVDKDGMVYTVGFKPRTILWNYLYTILLLLIMLTLAPKPYVYSYPVWLRGVWPTGTSE